MKNGHTFTIAIDRGGAWKRIRQATALIDASERKRCAPPWYTPPKGEGHARWPLIPHTAGWLSAKKS